MKNLRNILLSLLCIILISGCEQESTFSGEIEGWVGFGECYTLLDMEGNHLSSDTAYVVRTKSEFDRLYQTIEEENEGKAFQCKKPEVDFDRQSMVVVYFLTRGCESVFDFNVEFDQDHHLCIVDVEFQTNERCHSKVKHICHFLVPAIGSEYSIKYKVN